MSDTPDKRVEDEPALDDLIMAYADGALAPAERSAVRDALARQPELMQRFESFLFTRGPLARPFDAVLAAPIPERLLRVLRDPAPPPRTRPTASLLSRLADSFRMPAFSPALAIPAFLVAATAGWVAHDALRSDFVTLDNHGLVASAPLQRALEQTAVGAAAGIAGGLTIKPTFTFASVQKTWCRQYQLSSHAGAQSGGLACRGEDGVWRVVAHTAAEPSSDAQGKTMPAGQGEDVLDGIRAQIKDGDVLGPNDEERLIKQHWQAQH
jgi:anti-sigma factor RsiW